MKYLIAACALAPLPAFADWEPSVPLSDAPVVREATEGLDGHTLFRPANANGPLPVVLWGNGACRDAHFGYTAFLTGLAARGYAVIAVGGPGESSTTGESEQPERLIAALDWVEGQDQFDASKIATAGTSCGGLEALLAGADPRVGSILALNTGFWPEGRSDKLKSSIADIDAVTAPTLILYGGDEDKAAENARANFDRTAAPTVLVSFEGVGHSGLTYGIREGDNDMGIIIEAVALAAGWFDMTLMDGSDAQFVGEGCTYCGTEGFTVQSKGF